MGLGTKYAKYQLELKFLARADKTCSGGKSSEIEVRQF